MIIEKAIEECQRLWQEKEIPVSWDNEQEIFVPSEKGERKWKLLKIQ